MVASIHGNTLILKKSHLHTVREEKWLLWKLNHFQILCFSTFWISIVFILLHKGLTFCLIIGASLSEPHTSKLAVHFCLSVLVLLIIVCTSCRNYTRCSIISMCMDHLCKQHLMYFGKDSHTFGIGYSLLKTIIILHVFFHCLMRGAQT